jgi:hypothetical protein
MIGSVNKERHPNRRFCALSAKEFAGCEWEQRFWGGYGRNSGTTVEERPFRAASVSRKCEGL